MEPLYNIYYAGELLPGQEISTVREQLGRLFKAGDETLDKLFSGAPQLVKRGCNKATAVKYQQAMEKAGAKAIVKTAESAEQTAPTAAPPQDSAQTAAERIAALAAAPDLQSYKGTGTENSSDPENKPDSRPEPAAQNSSADNDSTLDIEAPGADVLKPEERAKPVEADIDTSSLDLDLPGERLSQEQAPPPAAPDTSSLSMGDVGEDIPTLPSTAQPLNPDTSGINLSPEGTDFSDCTPPEPAPPKVDLSGLDIAPAGSDVIEDKYRKKEQAQAPDTGHISLEE